MRPDCIIINARIWTGESGYPHAQAIAIKDRRIMAIGTNEQIQALASWQTKLLDAAGNFVLPGFIDNHTHFMLGGFQLCSLDLRQVGSKEAFIQAIAARAVSSANGQWLTGGGWNNDQWTQPQMPVKEWIDVFTADIPVYLARSDLHIGFVNSAALRLAGIDANTSNPSGGVIDRHPDTGEPTGILKDQAIKLVQRCIPEPSKDYYDQAMEAALLHAGKMGITSVQDITAWQDWKDWETFVRFQQDHKLTVRIYARTQISEWEKQLALKEQGFAQDDWLRLGGVKGFVDGSLGSGTAFMARPYDDAPSSCGLLADQMFPEGIMQQRIAAADQAGLPVSVHAIGDQANHVLLDIFEAVIQENGPKDRRFRIEHAQHLLPEDIRRMARLGVLASVQPGHVFEDGCWAAKRIGEERCRTTYAFRSLLNAGVPLSFGTDWPVVPLNPFQGIYTAMTRHTQDGRHPGGWVPEQKLTMDCCLQAYTGGGAYAEFAETHKGSLRVGKLADLILVSRDVLAAEPEELRTTRVLWTMAGGKMVYQE